MPKISKWGLSLSGHYPNPADWPTYKKDFEEDAARFVRLWLTEGIPFAFQQFPIIFETSREELALRLDISSREVSIVGSARAGYSFDPNKFGVEFAHGKSDFDFFVASEDLFKRLKLDAETWISRYRANVAIPTKAHEIKYWPGNADALPQNIRNGFISSWMLPLYDRYEHAMQLNDALVNFQANLNERLPREYRASKKMGVRVYRNFDAAVRKITADLISAWRKRRAA